MKPDQNVQRNPDLIAADLDGDTVMMDIESGKYFALNPVGTHIWETLENPGTLQSLIDSIHENFEVEMASQMNIDISEFLDELIENGLIQVTVQ